MRSRYYHPKVLIYSGDEAKIKRAVLISSPDEYTDVLLERVQLDEVCFSSDYLQVAAAAGVELINIDDIKIIENKEDENEQSIK